MERLLHVEHWQDDYDHAKDLGTLWTLKKGGHTATCVLRGHPLGIEARVLIDGEVRRTEAFRTADKSSIQVINTTWAWREAFEAKGWRGSPS